jgi:hypothetical protein
MNEIKKKIWPEYFEKILQEKKNTELRLADFEIKEGDILILEEYNPKTKKYTGRSIRKKVGYINKFNPTEAHSLEEIKQFGFYLIELK